MDTASRITASRALEGTLDIGGRPLVTAFKQALINLDLAVAAERAADAVDRYDPDYISIVAQADADWKNVRIALQSVLEMTPADEPDRQMQALALHMRILVGEPDAMSFRAHADELLANAHLFEGTASGFLGGVQRRLTLACEILAEDLSGLPLFGGTFPWEEMPAAGTSHPLA